MDVDTPAVLEALGKDKKREGTRIRFVLLDRIGHAVVESLPLETLRDAAGAIAP
jgi:3-dehydroquinate synthase